MDSLSADCINLAAYKNLYTQLRNLCNLIWVKSEILYIGHADSCGHNI